MVINILKLFKSNILIKENIPPIITLQYMYLYPNYIQINLTVTVVILDACRMCELLGIFKPLIIIQVQLSLTVVRFKCNLSVNRLAFERMIKRKLESERR